MAASLKNITKVVLPNFRQNVRGKVMQCFPPLLRCNSLNIAPLVYMSSKKHYDPKWRKWRKLKFDVRPINQYKEGLKYDKMTHDEIRMEMKKRGEYAPVTFNETNITIAATNEIMDEYTPPEGDGKKSFLSKQVVKKSKDWVKWNAKTVRDRRVLKKWEGKFDKKALALELQDLYIEAHKMLQDFNNNKEKLFDYVTEYAYPQMTFGLENKTMQWEFVESIEPPQIVQIRVQPMLSKDNHYSQLTVRMHTRQKLAIYDRFGRIMYGSENLIKDVLEYVIFEKHIVNEYGRWRVHGKIIPTWLPEREPLITTIRKPKDPNEPTKPPESGLVVKKETKIEEKGVGGQGSGGPQLATA